MESLPEGGERCFVCYRLRLERSAQYAVEHGFDYFCSTLSISPMKNAAKLNEIGAELSGIYPAKLLPSDFKKKGGYLRSIELSREYGLYRQTIVRWLQVSLVLTPFRAKAAQQILVCWSGLRGAASIVFAMMVTQSLKLENDIYHIVFTVVLFSILFQGTLLPAVARKLDMIDESDTVLKTFNDYSNEVPVQFIQFMVTREHAWCGRALCEINLPPETLVVLLERESKNIVPNGQTILLEGDRLILSALAPEEVTGIRLLEKHLEEGHKYVGKKLSEIRTGKNELIIMIQREGSIIIPNGNDVLQAGDMVVINRSK